MINNTSTKPILKRLTDIEKINKELYSYGQWMISKLGDFYHGIRINGTDHNSHMKETDLHVLLNLIDKKENIKESSFSEWLKTKVIKESIYDKNLFKSVLMLGGPGAGKSYITHFFIDHGFRPVQSDMFFERYMKKADMSLSKVDLRNPKQKSLFDLASINNDNRLFALMKSMIPVVVESTGRNLSGISWIKKTLEESGYDVWGLLVNTTLEQALERNKSRARSLSDKELTDIHKTIKNNLDQGDLHRVLGKNLLQIENKGVDLKDEVGKIISEIINSPLKNPIGHEKIHSSWEKENSRRQSSFDLKPGFPNL